jgi:hypothetical protein
VASAFPYARHYSPNVGEGVFYLSKSLGRGEGGYEEEHSIVGHDGLGCAAGKRAWRLRPRILWRDRYTGGATITCNSQITKLLELTFHATLGDSSQEICFERLLTR